MDQSYSEGDISMSPSQILGRLHMLRELQLLQKGILQKQQLKYHDSPEVTSSITEIVSHFSNSTSYNTFRSLLQSSQEISNEISPQLHTTNISKRNNLHNVIEGVSMLNLAEESEDITNTPISSRSTATLKNINDKPNNIKIQKPSKKEILLDDIPILSPKKDFETLVKEKLSNEKNPLVTNNNKKTKSHKPFLRRGEGTARFGLRKKDFIIQNTKSLPWRKKKSSVNLNSRNVTSKENSIIENVPLPTVVNKPIEISPLKDCNQQSLKRKSVLPTTSVNVNDELKQRYTISKPGKELVSVPSTVSVLVSKPSKEAVTAPSTQSVSLSNTEAIINYSKGKHPFESKKEKTWAAVLTKEQDDFLRQLKQSAYYKNFASPAKSTISDVSCNEQLSKLKQDREKAEQNMFELIERKVSNESFAIDNSFFNRFMGKSTNLECSGESTPLIFQKCLYKNPDLMHIQPDIMDKKRTDHSCSDAETCDSECTECCDNCSTISSCCSCKTVTQNISHKSFNQENITKGGITKKHHLNQNVLKDNKEEQICHNDNVTVENDDMNANMAEMNAKLIATSELLKDRLRELEDEIETFRKENANLTKMREEVDLERQKFYEEKTAFEQKFNEEKVLSEYYLAEEKEKLNKQKQIYDRYVRDMRGRLNKKEKDEVASLKKEVHDLKEEIRAKDAKSTTTIARLRNQLKIAEKDKKNLEDDVEKLKKENRRIQHSNEMTRRLTNIKYLEQINKKLSNMSSKDRINSDVKYKAFEIERQSRSKNMQQHPKGTIRPRAKSVPNLNVTSRYAKYFSQKDSISEREQNKTITNENFRTYRYSSENDEAISDNEIIVNDYNVSDKSSDSEEDNNLEIIYNERFKAISPTSKRSSTSISINSPEFSNSNKENSDDFFLKKSLSNGRVNSSKKLLSSSSEHEPYSSVSRKSKSPTLYNRKLNTYQLPSFSTQNQDYTSDYHTNSNGPAKSPTSIPSISSQKMGTVINNEICTDSRMIPSPEQILSKTSLTKTNLSPIEIRKPDGSKELKFPNGNIKIISADGKYSKFIYYNGDIKENFYSEGRIKYYYAETKTFHTTHPDGLEVLEFSDGQVEKRYKDGSSEIRLPNGSVRYFDPKNEHIREEWRFPDGAALTVSANGEQRIVFPNGQIEVHTKDHKRREFPDGTIKLIYNDGTSETRYASGRVRIKDKHGNLIMDSAPG